MNKSTERFIKKLYNIAAETVKGEKNLSKERIIWDMVDEWNHKHPDKEIFFCETDDGFAIDDDLFRYSN
jgi:hypothetical protein